LERLEQGSVALVNGDVFTSDPDRPKATAIGIWRGTIAYVGDDAQQAQAAAGPNAEVIDLARRTATPGLIDAHMHPMLYGQQLLGLNLTDARSVDDMLGMVRQRADATPAGTWISGWGYYPLNLREGRMPTLAELDAVSPEHPVALTHRSGHEVVSNSAAMRLAGLTRAAVDPVGGYFERDAQGELTGVLVENAMSAVNDLQADPGPQEYDRMLRAVTDRLLELGITSSTEANLEDPQAFAAYQRMTADPTARRVRYNVMFGHWPMLDPALSLGLESGFGNRWLRCGTMKFFIDGTEGMRTAKLSQPFADDADNTGMWMFPPEEFRERVLRAHMGGWQCATHAIGDAAVELTLDAYREAQEQLPRPDIRHRIEHASLLRQDLVERFAREGVIPVPGGRFASNDYPVLIERFGPERMRWYQPWNSLMERNVPVVVSSDAPVQTPDPGKNLRAIVTSRAEHDDSLTMQPEERIDLGEALLAYTRNGAWASHEERVKGILRPGMIGDVTVITTNIFDLAPENLDTIEAALTIVDGTILHRTL
jgi:predicted amidohydrolase YtcJ